VPNPSDPLAIARRTAAEFRERVLARDAQEQRREKIRTALGRCAFLMAPSNPKFFNERPDGEALKLEFRWAVAAQMTPLDKRWPAANAAYCRLWLERWDELAAALLADEGLPILTKLCPPNPIMRAMHDLLCRHSTGCTSDSVLKDLTALRAGMEPSQEELQGKKKAAIGGRGDLGKYFEWLRRELERTWSLDARAVSLPESPLDVESVQPVPHPSSMAAELESTQTSAIRDRIAARRSRAVAAPGWIYLKDAQSKYEIFRSTLHDWAKELPVEARRTDEDSGQTCVREADLLGLLRRKGRL
jgi:hypothetical protein